MTSSALSLSEGVRQFIAKNIDSVPELEALLLLSDDPSHDWSAAEAAARIYVDVPVAARLLEGLQRRHLVSTIGNPARYRFAPQDRDDAERVAEVARAYRTHLIAIATFIHTKASASVQEFARAFDFKKDR